jgi:exopolysaccharide biosynthesis polyprenyl glycosylphosphotransferase
VTTIDLRAGLPDGLHPLVEPVDDASPRRRPLWQGLVALDAGVAAAAWAVVLVAGGAPLVLVAVAASCTAVWLAAHGQYGSRPETTFGGTPAHVYESAVFAALGVGAGATVAGADLSPAWWALGAGMASVGNHVGRGAWSTWLRRHRVQGRHLKRAVVFGAGAELTDLVARLEADRSLGFHVAGIVELSGVIAVAESVRSAGADTAVVATGSMDEGEVVALVRELGRAGIRTQLVGGLLRIDARRLRPVALGREATMLIEPVSLDGHQARVKRLFDILAGAAAILLAAPLLLVTAVAVKVGDGGPILFRQERIGRDGRPFTMLKFRSMVVDAEARLADLQSTNQRSGPLFKAANDPRITKVGRILRATSLDELPQLVNVLRGEMSLVGPRPALAPEIAQFPDELLHRHDVPPGITGLWQVEGRDTPDFGAYEESDLYYVENWSPLLDLSILARTVGVVLGRAARHLLPGERAVILD